MEQVQDPFERLLDALPRIADSVKQFESEGVQQQVINGLLQALMTPAGPAPARENVNNSPANEVQPDPLILVNGSNASADSASSNGSTRSTSKDAPKRKRAKGSSSVDAVDFDWAPNGVESLADFVSRKSPKSNVDRNLTTVFYLQDIAKQTPITVGHIVSAFYACGWNVPTDPRNSLSVTRSQSKGIDTTSLDDIKITHLGRNIVNNQLPRPEKK